MTRKRQTQHLFTRAPPTSLATSTHQHTVPRRHTHPHPKGHDHHPRTEAKHTSSHQHLGTLPPPHPLVPAPTHHSRDRNQISFSSPTATQPNQRPHLLSYLSECGAPARHITHRQPRTHRRHHPPPHRPPAACRQAQPRRPSAGGRHAASAGVGPAVHAGGPSPPTRAAHHRR